MISLRYLSIFLTFLMMACSQEMVRWNIQETLTSGGIKTLDLEAENGNITLSSHGENTITARADFSLRANNSGDMKTIRDAIRLRLIREGEIAHLRIVQPSKKQQFYMLSVDLSVQVPEAINLAMTTTNGNILVEKIVGDVKTVTANGNIQLKNITGQHHRLLTVNGNLELLDINGAVLADTSNGHIKAHLKGVNRPDDYRFSTANGAIEVRLPIDSSAKIKYSKGTGDIRTDFKLNQEQSVIEVGKGVAHFEISTSNGDIKVLKD